MEQKLVLFYLVNDVVQHAAREPKTLKLINWIEWQIDNLMKEDGYINRINLTNNLLKEDGVISSLKVNSSEELI